MSVALGDIVHAQSGQRYVVLAFAGAPASGRLVRLVRFHSDGQPNMLTRQDDELVVVESPTFEVGESVICGGRPGVVAAPVDASGLVRVTLSAHRRPLKSDPRYGLEIPETETAAPIALLVLENRRAALR